MRKKQEKLGKGKRNMDKPRYSCKMSRALIWPLVYLVIVIFFLLLLLFFRFLLFPDLLQNFFDLLMLFIDRLVPIDIVFPRDVLDFFAQHIAIFDERLPFLQIKVTGLVKFFLTAADG